MTPSNAIIVDECDIYGQFIHVRAVDEGSITITVTADNGISASTEIISISGNIADYITSDETQVSMKPGETKQLQYSLVPADADDKAVFSLEYEDYNNVEVEPGGLITAKECGHATVKAQITNGRSIFYQIYVSTDPSQLYTVNDTYTIPANQNRTIVIDSDPFDARRCRKHVVSSDPSVAYIGMEYTYDTGIYVNAGKAGTATVTVTADNGVSCSFTVNVLDGAFADNITAVNSDIQLGTGSTVKLEYKLESYSGLTEFKDEKVTWIIEHGENCISLGDNGEVTGIATGTAYVRAEITNGTQALYWIRVYDLPDTVSFDKQKYTVNIGYPYFSVHARGKKNGKDVNCSLQYSTAHPAIAEISDKTIIPKKAGKTMIIATAENGVYGIAELEVVEGDYADYIRNAGGFQKYIKEGETSKLSYTLVSNADPGKTEFKDEKVTWMLSNYEKGSFNIDNDGNITALKNNQTATVRATITNGNYVSYQIKSCSEIESIQFNENRNYRLIRNVDHIYNPLEEGYVSCMPKGSKIRGLNYSSSDPSVISVSENGEVIPVGTGTAIITAYSKENPEISLSHTFESADAVNAPKSIKAVTAQTRELCLGYYYRFEVEYEPFDSLVDTDWTSSDTEIVELWSGDRRCTVKPKKQGGPVLITASSKSDSSVSVSFEVTVGVDEPSRAGYEFTFTVSEQIGSTNESNYYIGFAEQP